MGVTGLWDILRPAGTSRSFTAVAVDGFTETGLARQFRGFRVGIDASIWFVHSTYGKEGENPELRTIFFRLTRLLKLPFLPLFVFDGPMRPDVKRGKMIDKKPHWMIDGMKKMVEAFGFEWRTAPGEAEAELAYLNRIGVIDAVLSDDVDTFVFGAGMVIRNPSDTLSGNRSHIQATKNHTMTFSADAIGTHPAVGLTYKDLILVALLSGGDYHGGLDGCGVVAAVALARAGFGQSLVAKVQSLALSVQHAEGKKTRVSLSGPEKRELDTFLAGWRAEVADELRTNSHKLLGKRSPRAAANLLALGGAFPDIDVLMAYINPVTSEERAVAKAVRSHPSASGTALAGIVRRAKENVARNLCESIVWARDPSVGAIAKVCEDYFEWGYRDRIVQRFTNWLWEGIMCRRLRRKTILRDPRSPDGTPATATATRLGQLGLSSSQDVSSEPLESPARPLILKITSTRTHATTDHLLEYRLEIDPRSLVRAAEAGLAGRRSAPTTDWSDDEDIQDAEDGGGAKKDFDEGAPRRYWLPACMVAAGEPELARAFEDAQVAKEQRKAARPRGRGRARAAGAARGRSAAQTPYESDGEDRRVVSPVSSPDATPRKNRATSAMREAVIVQPEAEKLPARMNEFFKASKSTIPAALRAEKEPAPPPTGVPGKKHVATRVAKSKGKAPAGSSIGRVAMLFDTGDELRVVKDLTKLKKTSTTLDKLEKAKSKATLFGETEYTVFKDLAIPKERRTTVIPRNSSPVKTRQGTLSRTSSQRLLDDLDQTVWSQPLAGSSMGSPMHSVTNLGSTTDATADSQPEAGSSKPSAFVNNLARVSTWKSTPFPMSDPSFTSSSDEDAPTAPVRCATPSSRELSRQRARRVSSPRPSDTTKRSDELQKSPRKSKEQSSTRSTSVSPSRGPRDQDAPSMDIAPPSPVKHRPWLQRRAIMKPTHVIEISSDSDVPVPPKPKPKDLRGVFIAQKASEPAGLKDHKPLRPIPTPPPPDAEVIDLCSD